MVAPGTPATIFLDRDGVLNRKPPEGEYVTSPEGFQWEPGAIDALHRLAHAGSRVVIVTNQRGVALGQMTGRDLDAIHSRLRTDLETAGVPMPAIYACPHALDSCRCRKPGVGLFEMALTDDPAIVPDDSAVVGDSLSDLEAGVAFGVASTHLIASGPSREDLERLAAERGIPIDSVHPSLADLVANRFELR